MMLDRFNRNIIMTVEETQDVYSVENIILSFPSGTDVNLVIAAFNGMAPEGWVDAPTADEINKECSRRIYIFASDNTQKNLTANFAAGLLSADDQQAYKDGLSWISAMQEKARELIANLDPNYRDNTIWPVAPINAIKLAQRY